MHTINLRSHIKSWRVYKHARINAICFSAAALFLSLGVQAEISMVGEIQPISKAAVLNTTVLVNKMGASEVPLLDKFTPEFSEQQNIQFILKQAVYHTPNLDITSEYLDAYKSKTPLDKIDLSRLKLHPIIAVINSAKVISDSDMGQKLDKELSAEFGDDKSGNYKLRLEQGKINIIKKANPLIIKLSEHYGISILLESAIYVDPSYDITQDMIRVLNGQANIEQLQIPLAFTKPEKVAGLDGKKYLELFKASDQEKILKEGNQAIKEISIQQGIGVVLSAAVYCSPSIDITDLVINLVKKKMDVDSQSNQIKKK